MNIDPHRESNGSTCDCGQCFTFSFDIEGGDDVHPIEFAHLVRRNVAIVAKKAEHGTWSREGKTVTMTVWGEGADTLRRQYGENN